MAAIEMDPKEIPGLPRGVEAWEIKTGADATGDPAVWVWVKIRDEVLDKMDGARREKVRNLISAGIRKKTTGQFGMNAPWVYVRFLGSSEAT